MEALLTLTWWLGMLVSQISASELSRKPIIRVRNCWLGRQHSPEVSLDALAPVPAPVLQADGDGGQLLADVGVDVARRVLGEPLQQQRTVQDGENAGEEKKGWKGSRSRWIDVVMATLLSAAEFYLCIVSFSIGLSWSKKAYFYSTWRTNLGPKISWIKTKCQ